VLHLAGSPDYQLRVACRDTAELDVLLRTLRMELGAADTETKIILRSGPPPVARGNGGRERSGAAPGREGTASGDDDIGDRA
jgi:Lrp/AsnC ligand binding domain